MLDARDIARHLVRIGCPPDAAEEGVLLTPLRLQKLLYYCQGWHLALAGEPLFYQPLEAWTNGPVVRDVYSLFAGSRSGITLEDVGEPGVDLPRAVRELLEMVWREYAKFTPGELVVMTHHEPAWVEARSHRSADAKCSTPLSLETMRSFFVAEGQKRLSENPNFPPLDPAAVWAADRQIELNGGRGIPAAEAIRRAKAARTSQS